MEKVVVSCPKCKKKMKIINKAGKYRCPSCSEVLKFGYFRLQVEKFKRIGKGFTSTISEGKRNLKYKWDMAKKTAHYMQQVKKNKKK